MFENYMIVDGSLRNLETADATTGYSIDARIAYYRGLGLSMIEIELTVDGERAAQRDLTLSLHGVEYPATELNDVLDDRWGFTETATLRVSRPGGLTVGSHTVELTELLRISYASGDEARRATKVLTRG